VVIEAGDGLGGSLKTLFLPNCLSHLKKNKKNLKFGGLIINGSEAAGSRTPVRRRN